MRKFKALALALLLTIPMTAYCKEDTNYQTVLEQATSSSNKIYPTEQYNIVLKINKVDQTEEYTYYDRESEEATTFKLKDGKVVNKITESKSFHPYSLLYKENTDVIFPDIENVYCSYVTLPDAIDHIEQVKTGAMGYMNCAPTCIAMTYNWAHNVDKYTGITGSWIRSTYPSDEGDRKSEDYKTGYTISQMADIYKDLGMDFYESGYYSNCEDLIRWLNEGRLITLSVEIKDLNYNTDKTSRIDKAYGASGGHALLCSGYLYVIVENPDTGATREQLYLEIIDPAETPENSVRYYTKDSFNHMLYNNNARYIAVKHE